MTTVRLGKTLSDKEVKIHRDALTSHVATIGMTGSGKTGLLLGLTEELVRQKTPVVLLDVKGDMINIALQQSDLSDKMFVRCITPGGMHGEPVNVFADLKKREKISTVVSSILRMVGEDPNPLKSRAHAYLSTILQRRHTRQAECQLVNLVRDCQDPGFHHLGAMDIDYAFPKRSRVALAGKLNNLLVAPTFQPWREGLDLNMENLFLTPDDSKVPVIVYSVAHLTEQSEQVFAASLLFEEMLRWIKQQPGADSLQAAMIVDECVGLLPPHPANPPTKRPLLLMLKQARAFGVSCVLATQNPVDLDYKAMSNCQTWMIGRLQMEKDRSRVVKGACGNSAVSYKVIDRKIASLQSRQFVVVRPKGLSVVHTRDVDCEMRGPMTPESVEDLYDNDYLDQGDLEAILKQRLHIAKRELMMESSTVNIQKVSDLEEKLKELQEQ